MAARIKDIATLAKVSPATVSLVLNGKPGVGEETRNRIRSIAQELKYQTHKNVESIDSPANTICFLHIARHGHTVNRDHDVFIADYIEGLGQAAKAEGLSLQVYTFKTSPIETIIARARELEARGIVILGTELSFTDAAAFSALEKPLVFIDTFHEFLPFDYVDMNNEDSIFSLVAHLEEKGHRKIGLVRSSMETRNFKLREDGFRASMKRLALKVENRFIFSVDSTFHGAKEDMAALIASGIELPSALVCANDIIACGCLRALNEAGIRVPEQLSLTGFDDLPLSSVVDPPLTTIQVSKAQIGRMAVRLLTDRLRGNDESPPVKCVISGKLIKRSSVLELGAREDEKKL
ncbi:substrate-binding domain-containing protein [Treponema sp.]